MRSPSGFCERRGGSAIRKMVLRILWWIFPSPCPGLPLTDLPDNGRRTVRSTSSNMATHSYLSLEAESKNSAPLSILIIHSTRDVEKLCASEQTADRNPNTMKWGGGSVLHSLLQLSLWRERICREGCFKATPFDRSSRIDTIHVNNVTRILTMNPNGCLLRGLFQTQRHKPVGYGHGGIHTAVAIVQHARLGAEEEPF